MSAPVDPNVALTELASTTGLPILESLSGYTAAKRFLSRIPIAYARTHKLMGFEAPSGSTLAVAICDLDAWPQLDVLSRLLAVRTEPLLAPATLIQAAINQAYSIRDSEADTVLHSMGKQSLADQLARIVSREDLLDVEGRAPIIRLVNQMLFDAVVAGASDIHLQPYEEYLIVRQRIDGVLFDVLEVPKRLQEEVLTRVKVLGRMNIAEKRLPQDGRATVQLGDRVVDLRIASLPTSHNERIVIRLLDKSARLYSLGELGMPPATLRAWQQLIRRDHGLILVTGPTGSGKSTTLYGALQEVNAKELNILTLEDPIEYQLDGISQTQINEKKGMTFASGMRNLLRQDPDIIMIGEIRDAETATMAIQASLTGHLVFSTLHTNDAASAITRLLDLGVEPYLVSSSLVAALAQRLVRSLCSACQRAGDEGTVEPVGCQHCRGSGYRGRLGIFELLVMNEPLRGLVVSRSGASQLRQAAIESGMTLLMQDGHEKIKQGRTTLQEVLRVTNANQTLELA